MRKRSQGAVWREMKDIQNLKDTRNVDIQKVGIKHIDVPLIIQRKNNSNQVVCAKARVSVSLPRDYKGTHMSRFVEVLNEWQNKNLLGIDIKGCLEKIIKNLDNSIKCKLEGDVVSFYRIMSNFYKNNNNKDMENAMHLLEEKILSSKEE